MAEQGFCGEESVSGERGACAWVDVGEELVSSGGERVPVCVWRSWCEVVTVFRARSE